MRVKQRPKGCDKFDRGTCLVWAEQGTLTYCPPARADYLGPGECCHHPLVRVRPLLVKLRSAGVNLSRYGKKLRDVEFVERLYSAFLKVRASRSAASSRTSGRS